MEGGRDVCADICIYRWVDCFMYVLHECMYG